MAKDASSKPGAERMKDASSKPGAEQKKGAGSKDPDLPIDLPLHVKLQQSLELYGPLAVVM